MDAEVGIDQNQKSWNSSSNLLAWANSPREKNLKMFAKGQKGTVGRPKKTGADYALQEECRNHADEAMQTILSIMRGSDDDSVRLKAAQTILDRGFGKAVQQTQLTNVDMNGNTLDMNHTIVFVAAQPKCINP